MKKLHKLIKKYRKIRPLVIPGLIGLIVLAVPLVVFITRHVDGAEAVWAPELTEWAQRKRLTITNTSSEDMAASTTIAVTVNTKELASQGLITDDCSDIRVGYHASSSTAQVIPRHIVTASNSTCATSQATKVNFSLQAGLTAGSNSQAYYLYYGNGGATAPADDLTAYDIDSAQALLVCPFNGATDCINTDGTQAPTTESGAIRYSGNGTGSAMSFDGVNDKVTGATNSSLQVSSLFTVEGWVFSDKQQSAGNTTIIRTGSGSSGIMIDLESDSKIRVWMRTQDNGWNNQLTSTSLVTHDVWTHVAVTYESGSLKLYLNGTLDKTVTTITGNVSYLGTPDYVLGTWTNEAAFFVGKIDNLRLSDSIRYTSNFTPSTAPFITDDNTKLLLHFDENGDDPRNTGKALDASGNNNHGTISGAKYVSGLVGADSGSGSTMTGVGKAAGANSFAGHEGIFIEEGTTNKITNPSFENVSAFDTNWETPSTFNFDSTATTFTAGAAKRNGSGSGPFASGVLVSTDSVTYSKGTRILPYGGSSGLYETYDTNQGSLVLWWTPEYASSQLDTGSVTLFNTSLSSSKVWLSYDYGADAFVWRDGNNGNLTEAYTIAAGNTYSIVLRWDIDNTLDGTYYSSLSVNDTHYFKGTPGTGVTTTTDIGVGGSLTEGFTLYRRPLFDGTNGIDVGNGDEIAQIYGSGTAPKDPTLITGSWDVVFALPTNASTGALATGTGNAWTHPHLSNLLYTSESSTGGFMINNTYTTNGWADEGTPTVVAALDATEKIFSGGYKVTSDAADEGIYYAKAVTAGNDWVVRALGNSDATCAPRVILYDQTNGAEIGHLDGTTASTRTDPDVYIFTGEAPAGMTELRVKLINTAASGTCSWHQVEVLENLITNPSMETGAGDPWVPTGWTTGGLDVGEGIQEGTVTHSGSYSFKRYQADWNEYIQSAPKGTIGKFYGQGLWYRQTAVVGERAADFDESPNDGSSLQKNFSTSTLNSWVNFNYVGKSWRTNGYSTLLGGLTAGNSNYFDDFYSLPLTDVSLTVTPASEANSTESTGLRVDGTDTLTQPTSNLTTTAGTIKFKYTPRHSFATADLFGVTSPVIATFYADADDFLKLSRLDDSTLRLTGTFNGTTVNADYASPTLNAGTTYELKITYENAGNLVLYVDGVSKASASGVVSFGTAPVTAYFGTDNSSVNQADATFAAPANVGTVVATQQTTAPYYKFGAASAKLVATGDAIYKTNVDPNATSTHTLSAYVYNGTSGAVGGTVDATIAQLYFEGLAKTTTYTDMGGGWWRLTYSGATTDATNEYGLVVKSGKTVYVDGVQLEAKAYATTFVDGSLGTGYSWAGTADGSESSRIVEDIRYSNTSNLSNTGTISLWFKPNQTTGSTQRLFISSGDSSTYAAVHFVDNIFYYFWGSTGNTTTVTLTANKWYHVTLTQNGTNPVLYVNGTAYAGTTGTGFSNPGNVNVGASSGANQANSTISDFRTYDTALTTAQVTDLYLSGLITHSQQYAVDRFSTDKGQNPTAIWHLDEGYGTTANDATIYGFDGTLTGGPVWKESGYCVTGKCLYFDGTNDFIDIGDGPSDVNTISFWIRPSSTTQSILDLNGSAYVSASAGTLSATGFSSPTIYVNGVVSSTIVANEWQYVSIVTSTAVDASDLDIGRIEGTGYFDGFIDEIVTYPYARSAEQVKMDYNLMANASEEQSNAFLSEGLVGYWKMDDNVSGNAQTISDLSGNGNDGTTNYGSNATGMDCTGSGKFNKGCDLDGTDDNVRVATTTSTNITGTVTVASWINSDDVAKHYNIVLSKNYQYNLGFSGTTGKPRFIVTTDNNGTADAIGPTALSNDTWYHLVGVYDGTSVRLYVNGSEVNSDTASGGLTSANYDIIIGGQPNNCSPAPSCYFSTESAYRFNGDIDETRIYNRALSAAEVAALYEWAPGPVGHWKMDEGTGTSANDVSGNNNTGTLGGDGAGTDVPTWTDGKFGQALSFDGGDYVTVGLMDTEANGTTGIAVEAWIKRGDTSTTGYVLREVNSGELNITTRANAAAQCELTVNTTGTIVALTPNNTFPADEWHHLTCVYDGISLRAYVDGILRTSTPNTNTLNFGVSSYIVFGSTTTALFYNGELDDVRIYNYARTQKQIISDMNAGHPAVGSPVGSPIAHYRFDEQQGQTINNSGNQGSTLNGTRGANSSASTDDPTWKTEEDCKLNGCLSFDGTADYVNTGTSTSLASYSDFTITGWVKRDADDSTGMIYAEGSSTNNNPIINLGWTTDGRIEIVRRDSTPVGLAFTSTQALSSDTWQYLAFSNSGTSYYLYLDGVLIDSGTYTAPSTISIDSVSIGVRKRVAFDAYTKGSIDDVKIYNYALSESEVKLDYNASSAVSLSVLGASEASTLSDGAGNAPVAYWDFNEGANNTCTGGVNDVCDKSGNTNDGSVTGATWTDVADAPSFASGLGGKALSFDGDGDYVDAGTNSSVTSALSTFTVAGWVKNNPNSNYFDPLVSWGTTSSSPHIDTQWTEGKSIIFLSASNYRYFNNSKDIDDGNWHYVAFIIRGLGQTDINNAEMYLDGKRQEASTTLTSLPAGSLSHLYIGRSASAGFQDGQIDDVRIYNYARTPAQIAYDYNRGRPVAWYRFDECQGITANDASGNGNSGTINFGASGNTAAGTCSSGVTTEMWNDGTSGKFNSSLGFDGGDDKTTIAYDADLNSVFATNYSVSLWFNNNQTYSGSTVGALFDKPFTSHTSPYYQFHIRLLSSGQVQAVAYFTGDDLVASYPITNDQWQHVTVTVSTSTNTLKLYLNGVEVASDTIASGTHSNYSTGISIGSYLNAANNNFGGLIDDLRIYNYALSATQVKQVMNEGIASFN